MFIPAGPSVTGMSLVSSLLDGLLAEAVRRLVTPTNAGLGVEMGGMTTSIQLTREIGHFGVCLPRGTGVFLLRGHFRRGEFVRGGNRGEYVSRVRYKETYRVLRIWQVVRIKRGPVSVGPPRKRFVLVNHCVTTLCLGESLNAGSSRGPVKYNPMYKKVFV